MEHLDFEKEVETKVKQYMNDHTEKHNCENTRIETDNYNAGLEQGYEDGLRDGINFGYNKAIEWHDLRENSNDLPDTDRYVCVSNGKDWTKAFYSEGRWNIITLVGFIEVLGWCEAPKFGR